jgi:mannose-6-phosphate isomerase
MGFTAHVFSHKIIKFCYQTLAEELHRQHPDIYKDPNHKPELAIALTPFEALCGFRPVTEIKHFIEGNTQSGNIFMNKGWYLAYEKLFSFAAVVPELRTVVGQEVASELLESDEAGTLQALKNCFRSLMTCPKEVVQTQLQALHKRLASLGMPQAIILIFTSGRMDLVFTQRMTEVSLGFSSVPSDRCLHNFSQITSQPLPITF